MAGLAQGVDEAEGKVGGAEKLEEPDHSSSNWYFPRDYIEQNCPSRQDGIDLKKEAYLRKSYCTFLQDLGMRLKVPQVTIATAIVFCHRFFLRQSLAKNDRYLIATSCMFLAGKVEETPQKLCDVICLSYEIRNKKDPTAVQRIKQKDVYEPQKELVLLGERLVLSNLGFDLNVHHPYKPLVAAIKKFKVAQNALAQVAWNFVNDGLRTSLCLQFKPHHIAAGAIFLAAKFLKVKLPSEGEKVWWQEFDVTPKQLEEVSNQMLELYEQTRESPASRPSEPSTSVAMSNHYRAAASEAPSGSAAHVPEKNGAGDAKGRANTSSSKRTMGDAETSDNMVGGPRTRPDAASSIAEAETVPVSVVMCERSLVNDSKLRGDLNGVLKSADEASLHTGQAAEKDASVSNGQVSDGNGPPNEVNDSNVLPNDGNGVPNVDVKAEERSPNAISSRAGDTTQLAPNQACETKLKIDADVAEQGQNSPHLQAEPKSEVVDLGVVDIDRVKAAIQRRKKKGEVRPPVIKTELTDEEEMLEMDLESERRTPHDPHKHTFNKEEEAEGSAIISDAEAEELLEKGLEVGEGRKHHPTHSRDGHLQHRSPRQVFDSDSDSHHHRIEGDGHERDHKRARLTLYGQ